MEQALAAGRRIAWVSLALALLETHFNAKRPIDRIRSNEIEDFLDSKKATGRRRNNLRSEIITLFRYAQIRLRALHRDRKTEAELVLRDQTKRKQVETFSPEEFDTFLGAVRPAWLPWLVILLADCAPGAPCTIFAFKRVGEKTSPAKPESAPEC